MGGSLSTLAVICPAGRFAVQLGNSRSRLAVVGFSWAVRNQPGRSRSSGCSCPAGQLWFYLASSRSTWADVSRSIWAYCGSAGRFAVQLGHSQPAGRLSIHLGVPLLRFAVYLGGSRHSRAVGCPFGRFAVQLHGSWSTKGVRAPPVRIAVHLVRVPPVQFADQQRVRSPAGRFAALFVD